MKTIDFLPARFREQYTERAAVFRRWLIVTGLVIAVMPPALYQFLAHRNVVMGLVGIEAMHRAAAMEQHKLEQLEADLRQTRDEAALLAYLGHPWPRTQVLSQVQALLPSTARLSHIKLHEALRMTADPLASSRGRAARRPGDGRDAEPDDQRPPAQQDLSRLVEHLGKHETVVTLSGVTTDLTDLHTYVASLRLEGMFLKSELKSLESLPGKQENRSQRFEIRLVLAPGYSQPAGASNVPAIAGRASFHSAGRTP